MKRSGIGGKRGFTLLEVLVAMAILVIGIYALIRIFPVGLASIEYGKSRTIAAQLAEKQIAHWRLRADNLSDAIAGWEAGSYPTDYDSTSLDPDADNPNYQPDSCWLPRLIVGEKVQIQASGSAGLPFYLLAFAPIQKFSGSDPIIVYSTPYSRVDTLAELIPSWDRRPYYLDYQQGKVYFDRAAYDRKFKIAYSWLDKSGAGGPLVRDVVSEVMDVDANTSGSHDLAAASNANFQRVVKASDRVYQAFILDGGAPSNPGHYYFDPAAGATTGVVVFSTADAGRTVKIDYLVRDWQIIREDNLTVDGNGQIKLAFARLKDADYRNPPRQDSAQPVGQDGGGIDRYVVAVNLRAGGALYGDSKHTMWLDRATTNGDFRVTYKDVPDPDNPGEIVAGGTLVFPSSKAQPGDIFRIYYRVPGDWGIQMQKAAIYYQDSQYTNAPAYQQYQIAASDSDDPTRYDVLTFEPCEADKSVVVDYTYERSGRTYRATGELHKIADIDTASGSAYGFLLDKLEEDEDNTLTLVHSVRGVSVTARVIWAGPGKSEAGGTSLGEMWREARLSTYLTRPAGGIR